MRAAAARTPARAANSRVLGRAQGWNVCLEGEAFLVGAFLVEGGEVEQTRTSLVEARTVPADEAYCRSEKAQTRCRVLGSQADRRVEEGGVIGGV